MPTGSVFQSSFNEPNNDDIKPVFIYSQQTTKSVYENSEDIFSGIQGLPK
jgi:hypothetical protein